MKAANRLSFFSGILGFFVVALGAWTRLADAGLGCPDWPGCYGFLTLPSSPEEIQLANSRFPDTPYEVAKAIPEVVHRYFAAALGFFILSLSVSLFREEKASKNLKTLSFSLSCWVILQGVFGYLTVSLLLLPQIVTIHLMAGFLTVIVVWIIFFKTSDHLMKGHSLGFSKRINRLLSYGIFLVSVQIFLGAWTTTNYASFACPDLPLCNGEIFPEANFLQGFNFLQSVGPNYLGGHLDSPSRVAIHLSHRFGAIVVSLYLLYLVLSLYRINLKKVSLLVFTCLFIQILLGISNIVFHLPLLVAVGHNLGGLVLITVLSVLRFR